MTPMLADAIDIPLVLLAGIIVLVPLLASEVFVEALVLKIIWQKPYGKLCWFALAANLWSLLAGIPAKFLNSYLYADLLPQDIPGFFARYASVAAIGSLVYFVITLLVEGVYALGWSKRQGLALTGGRIWQGILLANIATYAVLAPLSYYLTKPGTSIRTFTNDTRWAANPDTAVLFVDGSDGFLKSMRLDGSGLKTIVPVPMTDYLVSTDLNCCLFRGTNGDLYIHRHDKQPAQLVWKTQERFSMNQVAFSPSGRRVAYASEKQGSIDLVDRDSEKRTQLPGIQKFGFPGPTVVWSSSEKQFFVGGYESHRVFAVLIGSGNELEAQLASDLNPSEITQCFGRVGDAGWYGGSDWGVSFRHDASKDLTANTWPGLDSALRISREENHTNKIILSVSVRPGWLHLADFYFGDVAFLPGGRECLFEANGYIYLLDIPDRRLGTLVKGDRFILLTPRYEKRL